MLDLRTFVNEVRVAENLVVIRTPPGHANAVARAVDLQQFAGAVGSIAGDDTLARGDERCGRRQEAEASSRFAVRGARAADGAMLFR
jgi:hypothetical protein